MTEIIDLISDHEVLLALEPEELAGVVIEFLNTVGETSQYLNRHNFGLPHTVQGYPREFQQAISEALMEAWVWLEKEGLLVPKPGINSNFVFISKRGRQITQRFDLESYRHSNLLPKMLLHPVIAQKVWASFIRGDYDTAVFQAFKEVEVSVRNNGGFLNTDYGVDLMRKAFRFEGGPLTDSTLPRSESDALQHLFAGSIGLYKNPLSHRTVAISNPIDAVEMIILASHLLRIIDSRITDNEH